MFKKITHILSGNHDNDLFITQDEIGDYHWGSLMSCYHQGQCDNDVNEAKRDFDLDDYKKAKNYLVECGIDDAENFDDDAVLSYYLWILSADIQEEVNK